MKELLLKLIRDDCSPEIDIYWSPSGHRITVASLAGWTMTLNNVDADYVLSVYAAASAALPNQDRDGA